VRDLLAQADGAIRLVTLAPEVEGSRELLEILAAAGVVAALGHSLASASQIDAAVAEGVCHVTHLFNAMGYRDRSGPGVAEHALADDRLGCDLICDGVHVAPDRVVAACKTKGERLSLITDRVQPALEGGFGSGELHDDGVAIRLPDGRLAGSSLTLERALRNAVAFGAMTRLEAVAACSFRPAKVLGLEAERGTLRVGARADLVALDSENRVVETWIGGESRYRRAS